MYIIFPGGWNRTSDISIFAFETITVECSTPELRPVSLSTGFDPVALRLTVARSNQLSYERINIQILSKLNILFHIFELSG